MKSDVQDAIRFFILLFTTAFLTTVCTKASINVQGLLFHPMFFLVPFVILAFLL